MFTALLLSLPSAEPAAPADGKAEFLKWANEVARGKKRSLCRTGQLRYSNERPGYFAALGDPKADRENQTILFSNGKKHWSYAERGLTVYIGCDASPAWEELETITIRGQDLATRWLWSEVDIAFIDAEPEVLKEVHSDVDGSSDTDWLAATTNDMAMQWDHLPLGPTGDDNNYGMLVVLPPDSRWLQSWKTPTYVSFGQKNWAGPTDADLRAYALDFGKAGVRIVVDITDDRGVPTPPKADARRLVRSDHLELWWLPREARNPKQLGIGLRADGTADVRWLLPAASTETPPAVRRAGNHFEIDLSPATLGIDPDKPQAHPDLPFTAFSDNLPFTVAFSDTDETNGKQETVIATSLLRWNRPDTFGQLTSLPSASRRFPTFGQPM